MYLGCCIVTALSVLALQLAQTDGQTCAVSCTLPACSCSRFEYPMTKSDIPQMVYFAFDDALTAEVKAMYDELFTSSMTNPNGCPMTMTAFISDAGTDYSLVKAFYQAGNEVGVKGNPWVPVANATDLKEQAGEQRKRLRRKADIPTEDIVGWRSPFFKTLGDEQPKILKKKNYLYDISLTYAADPSVTRERPWPFTLHAGWPYNCQIPPCPDGATVDTFWAVPINAMVDFEDTYNCVTVDGCVKVPPTAEDTFDYLMKNFRDHKSSSRAPYGLHLQSDYLKQAHIMEGFKLFLKKMKKLNYVYVLSVKQVLDWMLDPQTLTDASSFPAWGCSGGMT